MSKILKISTVLCLCMSVGLHQAFGHEGHGHTAVGEGETVKHYLTEPIHLVQVLVVVALASTIGWLGYRWFASKSRAHRIAS